MKLGELNLNEAASFLAKAKEKYSAEKAKSRAIFQTGSTYMKKAKYEAGKRYSQLYPLELCLPFDPETLSTEVFNQNNKLPMPGSPTTVALYLRHRASTDENFCNALCSALNCQKEELKVDSKDFTKDDINLWHKLARVQFITGYVQRLNTDTSTYKFGRIIGCEAIVDDTGTVTGTNGVGYLLNELEKSICAVKVQELNKTFEEGGSNADLPDKEKDELRKKIWDNRFIGNPFEVAYTRIISFPVTSSSKIDMEMVDSWNNKHSLMEFTFYQKIRRADLATIEEGLSGRVTDTAMDFIEVRVEVPKNDNNKVEYISISRKPCSGEESIFANDKGRPLNDLTDFASYYRVQRDDENMWSDEILHRSIFELRVMSDKALLAEMKNCLKAYSDVMSRTPEIVKEYSAILESIDPVLTKELGDKLIDIDEDEELSVPQDIVDVAPIDNEDNTSDDMLSDFSRLAESLDSDS